jgi:hypothetical protein
LLHPMLVLCMWLWWKMLEEHPVMHHGACMVKLIKLLPSKHVLMLNAPLISKIKNKLRACNEFKHKIRGDYESLKTSVSLKYFPTTFTLVSLVLFAFISWEKAFPGLIMGA